MGQFTLLIVTCQGLHGDAANRPRSSRRGGTREQPRRRTSLGYHCSRVTLPSCWGDGRAGQGQSCKGWRSGRRHLLRLLRSCRTSKAAAERRGNAKPEPLSLTPGPRR